MKFKELQQILPGIAGTAPAWMNDSALAELADGSEIYLEYDSEKDELYLYCQVACLPPERLADHAAQLLEANLFGRHTGGTAVLAYDPDESMLVLWDKLSLPQLTGDDFRERFAYLYLSKKHWSDTLRSELPDGDEKQEGAPFFMPLPSFLSS